MKQISFYASLLLLLIVSQRALSRLFTPGLPFTDFLLTVGVLAIGLIMVISAFLSLSKRSKVAGLVHAGIIMAISLPILIIGCVSFPKNFAGGGGMFFGLGIFINLGLISFGSGGVAWSLLYARLACKDHA